MFNNFFRGLLGAEEPLTKVLEVRSDSYVTRPIHYRGESILLYSPNPQPQNRNPREKYFEIVLQRPFTESLYSLLRCENQDEAEAIFITYKDHIPLFISLTRECTVASLQRLCDTLSAHRAWTTAHLAAHFRTAEMFQNPEVQKHIDDIDVHTGATPLMVAIETGDIRLVQCLVTLKCSLDAADLEGNNVFHYAAATNKEIVQILAPRGSQTSLNTYNKAGYTPLHVACLKDSSECVRALLLAGADVNLPARPANSSPGTSGAATGPGYVMDFLLDNANKLYIKDMKHGGTPLHWAISREVIEVLVDKNCNVNAVNFDGRTALHMMVLRNRLECAIALLSRGADHSIADNDGNTALHIAVKQTNIFMVQALIVFGADLEAKNRSGVTARHLVPVEMTSSNYDKILYILHAVGAKRCPRERNGCPHSCASDGDYNGVPPPPVARAATRDAINQMLTVAAMERAACLDTSQKTGRLLCLDGGGIRGLVLVQVLLELEAMVGKPIIHCFDWVAGTSTGGIIALALASGKTLRETQCLYFRMKEHAFVGMRPYSSEALEGILKECLGTETVMADIDHPKLMILAVLADRKPVDLHIFRNYQSAKEILDAHNGVESLIGASEAGDSVAVCNLPPPPCPAEQLVWQAARATGAAPSYFRAFGSYSRFHYELCGSTFRAKRMAHLHERALCLCDDWQRTDHTLGPKRRATQLVVEPYLDGGLIGNNPTLDVLTELAELRLALRATGRHEEAKKTDLKVVVSCGTGLIPVTKLKDIDVFKPESLWDTARLAWGISAIGTLLVDQATMSDGRVVDRARAWCSLAGVPYYRFSPPMSRDVAMDESGDDRLVTMLWESKAYMHQQRDRVRDVCELLR